MTARPPRRPRRPDDRITAPDAVEIRGQIERDYAMLPFDEVADAMDRKWGIDRLPCIVSPDLAQRYGRQMERMARAAREGTPDEVRAQVERSIRGLRALDAAAEADGQRPVDQDVIEISTHNGPIGVMLDDRAWKRIRAARPTMRLYSLNEVAVALGMLDRAVADAKDAFPGSTVIDARPKRTAPPVDLDDEIPF